jgi:23S rRNA A2030 N6-methylase RlmJ
LRSAEARKTQEFQAGIARVWHRRDYPAAMEPYLSAVRALNGIFPKWKGINEAQQAGTSISYAAATPTAVTTPTIDRPDRREYAWHHLLYARGIDPSTEFQPHFATSYPDAAFDPERLEFYPGSTLLGAYFQRQIPIRVPGRTIVPSIPDRSVACELHPTEFDGLKSFMAASKHVPGEPRHLLSVATRDRIHVVQESGFAGLRSTNNNVFLAPRQGRGLVLVDPPYEVEGEMDELLKSLPHALRVWPHGIYALWYPIIDYSPGSPRKMDVALFKTLIKQMNIPKTLCIEFDMVDCIRAARTGITPEASAEIARQKAEAEAAAPPPPPEVPGETAHTTVASTMGTSKYSERERGLGMTGMGMILINPPYQFPEQMEEVLQYLAQALPVPVTVQGHAEPQLYPATHSTEWINGESIPRAQRLAAATAAAAQAATAAPSPAVDVDAPLDLQVNSKRSKASASRSLSAVDAKQATPAPAA